jgi:hypothetical protein
MRRRWIVVALCLAAIAVGGVLSFDYLQRRQIAKRTACLGSLNRIRLTKLVYAEEHGLTNGAVIPDEVIWRENRLIERCFSGGHYSINPVGVDPSCNYTGLVRVHGRLLGHSLTSGLSQ